MEKYYSFTAKKKRAMRSFCALLGIVFLWGFSLTPTFAQSTSGNTITFDAHNSTMLFADISETQTQTQKYSCYMRHHQAPIQILNANPTANSYTIAPLQAVPGSGTGFFANSSFFSLT